MFCVASHSMIVVTWPFWFPLRVALFVAFSPVALHVENVRRSMMVLSSATCCAACPVRRMATARCCISFLVFVVHRVCASRVALPAASLVTWEVTAAALCLWFPSRVALRVALRVCASLCHCMKIKTPIYSIHGVSVFRCASRLRIALHGT